MPGLQLARQLSRGNVLNPYESSRLLAEYLLFHYGSEEADSEKSVLDHAKPSIFRSDACMNSSIVDECLLPPERWMSDAPLVARVSNCARFARR